MYYDKLVVGMSTFKYLLLLHSNKWFLLVFNIITISIASINDVITY